jgi:hypothetical protein
VWRRAARAYGLYCGGCRVDVLDAGNGEPATLAEFAAELGHVEPRLGVRVYHCVRRRHPDHSLGEPSLLTTKEADDVRRNLSLSRVAPCGFRSPEC